MMPSVSVLRAPFQLAFSSGAAGIQREGEDTGEDPGTQASLLDSRSQSEILDTGAKAVFLDMRAPTAVLLTGPRTQEYPFPFKWE